MRSDDSIRGKVKTACGTRLPIMRLSTRSLGVCRLYGLAIRSLSCYLLRNAQTTLLAIKGKRDRIVSNCGGTRKLCALKAGWASKAERGVRAGGATQIWQALPCRESLPTCTLRALPRFGRKFFDEQLEGAFWRANDSPACFSRPPRQTDVCLICRLVVLAKRLAHSFSRPIN